MGTRPQIVNGPGVPPVVGAYSPAVKAGEFVFVSGQAGMDPDTGELSGEGFREQIEQALANLDAVLRASGSSLDLVVSATVLLVDFADFAELNQAFEQAFPDGPPARMTMQVGLPGAVRISIGCTALVESARS